IVKLVFGKVVELCTKEQINTLLNIITNDKFTILQTAVKTGDMEIVRLVFNEVKNLCSPEQIKELFATSNKQGYNIFHSIFLLKINGSSIIKIADMIRTNIIDSFGETEGYRKIKYLLEQKNSNGFIPNSYRTAIKEFIRQIKEECEESIEFYRNERKLVSFSSDAKNVVINDKSKIDKNTLTVSNIEDETVSSKIIPFSADSSISNTSSADQNYKPIHVVEYRNHLDIQHEASVHSNIYYFENLIKIRYNVTVIYSNIKFTSLHYAAVYNRTEVVNSILESSVDFIIDYQDIYGATALHWAVYLGYTDMIKILIEKGARLDIQDRYNRTAFDVANEIASRPSTIDETEM
ncbi:MAG: ankyrin repeat domain-containing protein, partial [Rickettsiales bacterium]